ncbi:hypothetical protein LWI29_022053 [Acer saccharum]|uniref:Uncharacterized protein n=1 Tax=Acer saccharum TaxID=4024 RepID=A0AA39VEH1_ACESA|nr:hypothetical protein LWI29_022053 [Acer saccharum]
MFVSAASTTNGARDVFEKRGIPRQGLIKESVSKKGGAVALNSLPSFNKVVDNRMEELMDLNDQALKPNMANGSAKIGQHVICNSQIDNVICKKAGSLNDQEKGLGLPIKSPNIVCKSSKVTSIPFYIDLGGGLGNKESNSFKKDWVKDGNSKYLQDLCMKKLRVADEGESTSSGSAEVSSFSYDDSITHNSDTQLHGNSSQIVVRDGKTISKKKIEISKNVLKNSCSRKRHGMKTRKDRCDLAQRVDESLREDNGLGMTEGESAILGGNKVVVKGLSNLEDDGTVKVFSGSRSDEVAKVMEVGAALGLDFEGNKAKISEEILRREAEEEARCTYTDQPRLSKHEADRVAHAVQTSMESRNFKALVTAGSLKAFGLIPELINDRNHSSSELTGREQIDSIFKDLGPIPEWEASKIATDGSSKKIQKDTASVLPEQIVVPKVARPSATLSGFFGGEGSAGQAPAEATGSLLSEPDRLDPSVALRWAMTGELSFGSTEDFEAFNAGSMVDQGQKSLHFLTMLLRKCDLAVKDREKLTGQVSRLVEEKGKLLADNAKLLASQMSALAVEKMKNEESARRIAALEKQRDSLEFCLKDYESNFETAKVELGVRAIDLFKHSPAFEAFTHKEFMRGVEACKTLVRSLDHPTVADQIDESLQVNEQEAEENLKKQIARWELDRQKKRMPLLRVHTDLEARIDQCFGNSQPGNLWLDPLIDYGPDSESEGEDFYEKAFQDKEGDCEEDDQEEGETIAEDFRGDTGANLDDPGKNGKDDDPKD